MQDLNPIYLRELKHTDWKDVHAYCSQDRVCRFQAWGPNTADQTRSFVSQALDDSQKVPRTRFAQAIAAAGLMLKFGFEDLHLHRIYATCDPRNSGSSKVLTKIGMTYEGRLRDALLIKDGWRDSLVFSVLEQEWDKEVR